MSNEVKYWIVYVQGKHEDGQDHFFAITYSGKKILWEYLIEAVEEEYNLSHICFNGYYEISKYEYSKMRLE